MFDIRTQLAVLHSRTILQYRGTLHTKTDIFDAFDREGPTNKLTCQVLHRALSISGVRRVVGRVMWQDNKCPLSPWQNRRMKEGFEFRHFSSSEIGRGAQGDNNICTLAEVWRKINIPLSVHENQCEYAECEKQGCGLHPELNIIWSLSVVLCASQPFRRR